MSATPSRERYIGLVSYPKGVVFPPTPRDAMEDAIRYMGTQMPRDEVRELIKAMQPDRVVEFLQGMRIEPPLNTAERFLASTLEYYIQRGVVRSPFSAIGDLVNVRFDILHGGVFIGSETTQEPR